jgi:hypothetical protein
MFTAVIYIGLLVACIAHCMDPERQKAQRMKRRAKLRRIIENRIEGGPGIR